ncbi:MAG: hypothetical protein JXN64_00710 [Spirochaetes bacterium]|nr:hypothetical protein [Spirochaetota bacterium]
MYLLRICIICLTASVLFVSCKAEGPRSPEEAFDSFKNAYINSNTEQIEKLLSERSKEKIRAIIKMISSMNDSQLKALSKKFNTSVDGLRNLSIKDYLNIQLFIATMTEDDLFREILKHKIIGVDVRDRTAVVRVENGMELNFVKEGRYWKFDLEELSSKEMSS